MTQEQTERITKILGSPISHTGDELPWVLRAIGSGSSP